MNDVAKGSLCIRVASAKVKFEISRSRLKPSCEVPRQGYMPNFSPLGLIAANRDGLKVLASTVLEADFLRSANWAEIKNSNTISMPGSSKIALEFKYHTKQKSFINKVRCKNWSQKNLDTFINKTFLFSVIFKFQSYF